MPFDANLVCFDGSVDPMVGATPTTVAVAAGHAVLDLKETGAKGLAMVLVCTEAFALASDFINVSVQQSDDLAAWETIAVIPPVSGTGGGSDYQAPGVFMVRFASKKRYIRANVDVGAGDDVGVCYIMVSPHPFGTL